MRTWRIKASELFTHWRITRDRRIQARNAVRDKRAAEELDREREGAQRFPPTGGGAA